MYACTEVLYACTYVYICDVCGCVGMYVCIHVCMFVCIYVCLYVCMHVCMHACILVYMNVCMSVCMYVFMYVCMYESGTRSCTGALSPNSCRIEMTYHRPTPAITKSC